MPTSNFQAIRLLDPDYCSKVTYLIANSADPDHLASSEYMGSAGQGVMLCLLIIFGQARRGSTIGFHLLWHTVELAMSTRLCLL